MGEGVREGTHVCDFVSYKDMVFICSTCGLRHQCGSDVCEHLFFNEDFTSVCRLTGLCFEQRQCEAYIDTEKGLANIEVPTYHPRVKRDQQVKNRTMEYAFILQLIVKMEFMTQLSAPQVRNLVNKIADLWAEFVDCAREKGMYIHRKDKRCFVVAILFSLNSGICSSGGQVVMAHPQFELLKLNKKKSYGCFKVSDIRYGQKLIMKVFDGHMTANVVRVASL